MTFATALELQLAREKLEAQAEAKKCLMQLAQDEITIGQLRISLAQIHGRQANQELLELDAELRALPEKWEAGKVADAQAKNGAKAK